MHEYAKKEVKVLIVDNDPLVADGLSSLFSDNGYASISAYSALEGVETYESDEEIDLIVCSLDLPDFSAVEMVRRLRKVDSGRRAFKAIMLADRVEEADVIRALRAGFSDCFQKPINQHEFLGSIRRLQAALDEQVSTLQELGHLSRRLRKLSESTDELYISLKNASGYLPVRIEDKSIFGLPAGFPKLTPRQIQASISLAR